MQFIPMTNLHQYRFNEELCFNFKSIRSFSHLGCSMQNSMSMSGKRRKADNIYAYLKSIKL